MLKTVIWWVSVTTWTTPLLTGCTSSGGVAPAPLVTDGPVRAIAVATDATIYIGSGFTHVGATAGSILPRNHLAAIDFTGALTSWDPNADNNVNALAVSGTTVHLGGDFTNVGGQARASIAAVDSAVPLPPGIRTRTARSSHPWSRRPTEIVRPQHHEVAGAQTLQTHYAWRRCIAHARTARAEPAHFTKKMRPTP